MARTSRHRRGAGGESDFHGQKRANDTHESKTDPDARLYRKGKGQPSRLCFMGHALIENRHGLVVQADVTAATGRAERAAALAMIDRHERPPNTRSRSPPTKAMTPPILLPISGGNA
jgi:hypothetical protein